MTTNGHEDFPADLLDQTVCHCFGITYGVIREAVRKNHFKGIEQVTKYCQAGGGCHGCMADIRKIIDRTRHEFQLDLLEQQKWGKKKTRSTIPAIKRIRLIEDCLKQDVRALLDGTVREVKLIHIEGDQIELKLIADGPSDELYGQWLGKIQTVLREKVDQYIVAIQAKNSEQ